MLGLLASGLEAGGGAGICSPEPRADVATHWLPGGLGSGRFFDPKESEGHLFQELFVCLPQKENERWCFLLFYTMTPRGMCCFFPGLATFCSNFLTELAFGGKNIPCFPRVNGACAPTWNPPEGLLSRESLEWP